MKIRTTPLLLAAAAAFCSAVPAAASSIVGDQTITADCRGYTVTFEGTGFGLPGDQMTITWQGIQLLQDGVVVTPTYGGTTVMTAASGSTTASVSESRAWNVPMCGKQNVVDVRFPPTRFDWFNNHGGSGAGAFHFPDGTQLLYLPECPCDPPPPAEAICRTPGFWGTHAGAEKKNSQNITQQVIDEVGFLSVCGKTIDTTGVNLIDSALEGICVSPRGDQKLQLARHLTAAALNCVMTSGQASCADTPIAAAFAACNATCQGIPSALSMDQCIDAIDCFNNGGELLENGYCKVGTCGGDGVTACDSDKACLPDDLGNPVRCVPTPGNCHDRPLVNEELGLFFDPPGSAGSSKACNDATSNACTIFSCPAAPGSKK